MWMIAERPGRALRWGDSRGGGDWGFGDKGDQEGLSRK